MRIPRLLENVAAPLVLVAYARRPSGLPPRSWRGLVGYGRLDILVRVLLAFLYPTGRLEPHSQLLLYLDGGVDSDAILFDGSCLPAGAVYEHELGPYVLEALWGHRCRCTRVSGFGELVAGLRSRGYRVVLLRESGRPFSGYSPYTVYIVGLRDDPPLGAGEDAVESIGPRSYLASHVAAFIRFAASIPVSGVMRVKSGLRPSRADGLSQAADHNSSPGDNT
jgi:tRNA (pseudouridine54-N1)-methyltransferase